MTQHSALIRFSHEWKKFWICNGRSDPHSRRIFTMLVAHFLWNYLNPRDCCQHVGLEWCESRWHIPKFLVKVNYSVMYWNFKATANLIIKRWHTVKKIFRVAARLTYSDFNVSRTSQQCQEGNYLHCFSALNVFVYRRYMPESHEEEKVTSYAEWFIYEAYGTWRTVHD